MKKILATFSLIFVSVTLFAGTLVYAPLLVAPNDGAENLMPDTELDWTAVAGASTSIYYEIQIDNENTFPDPYTTTSIFTAINAPKLNFGEVFFWRVRAVDGDEISSWSEIRSFSTIAAFLLDRPRNDATNAAPNEEIKWKTTATSIHMSGIDQFEIMLDTSAGFSSPAPYHIVYLEDAAPIFNLNQAKINGKGLLFGEKFFWKVRGIHENDTSDWSEVFNFTVIAGTTLKDPSNAEVTDLNFDFKWNAINGVTNYIFQLSEDENFTTATTLTVLDRQLSSDTLEFGTTYYWRVACEHELDISAYTAPFSLTTKAAPSLNSPANGATNISTTPTLKWTKMSGPTTFDLQYSLNDATFTNARIITLENANSAATESYTINNVIDSATIVYWRVRAKVKTSQISEWSDEWSFTIASTGIGEDTEQEKFTLYPNPSNGAFTISYPYAEGALVNLQIVNLLGKVVYENTLDFSDGVAIRNIDANIPEGIYIIKLQKEKKVLTDKITICY
ncbi:MAG: T9SS type A sorting domain-containing protein [Bacteroidia bacterium]|nr:T9SS type A sorting domain-containing protein [Bacteroidia bacterium]HPE86544.1 T9SS type A sorting domain-containing protein [Bacteroidales bacterium]